MPETLLKLSPHRNIHLRGFSGNGAAAAITAASATGMKLSGVFRDAADFAVVILWDRDDFFGHPRFSYLPADPSLAGMVLSFDLVTTGLIGIDSAKSPAIDWPYLDVIRENGTRTSVSLLANAVQSGGSYTSATGVFTVATPGAVIFDRVSIWFQNMAFDFIAAGGETATAVAAALVGQINAGVYGGTYKLSAVSVGGVITITATVAVDGRASGADGNMIRMYGLSKNANLTVTPLVHFSGGSSSAVWTITLDFTALGIDQVRQMWLTLSPKLADSAAFTDLEWTATFTNWAVLDPSSHRALKVAGPNSVRVEDSSAWCTYSGSSWGLEAGFYSQGFAKRVFAVGDTVTVRISCQTGHYLYLGTRLYVDGGVFGVVVDGDAETLHDVYLRNEPPVVNRILIRSGLAAGTHTVVLTLRARGGAWGIGTAYAVGDSVSYGGIGYIAIAAGTGNQPDASPLYWLRNYCYFDFLEAAVPSDVPDPDSSLATISPAVDYDTDHGFKLSPQRLLWMFERLGFAGPMNEYLGVFWWNQRKVGPDNIIPSVVITFGGTITSGDAVFINVGGITMGKSVFPADTLATIAAHFAYFVNETFVGVWAVTVGPVLTITSRSPTAAYNFSFAASTSGGATVTVGTVGSLTGGVVGTWYVDPAQTPVLNRAALDWHTDLYAGVAAAGLEITTACSLEIVNPPDDPGAGQVWAARYVDGTAVTTSTGFGGLFSTHCATGASNFLTYQKAVYLELATLQATAGLTPDLQFGEFLWWFFNNASGMAYYDNETKAAALVALGVALHTFLTPDDDPTAAAADSLFLRNRLRDHVAAIVAYVHATVPAAKFEVLFPYDVNYPAPVGRYSLGGRLNAYVNLPVEWKTKLGSGLDRIKIEALDFGSGTRSLDLAKQAIALAPGWGWALADVRYLFPIFNGGCPWVYEQQAAKDAALGALTPFAMDHVCLFGWDLRRAAKPGAQLLL